MTMERNQRDGLLYSIWDENGNLKETEVEIAEIHSRHMAKTCSIANSPSMDNKFRAMVEREVMKITKTREGITRSRVEANPEIETE